MIEMTRLRLINWHNFQDDCIPVRNTTYLIGVNAVGKTTIVDAIRYCLTTSKNFNAAGNRKSSRTVQGSVHGKQRASDLYLRPGHTVAFVSVEFLDHDRNEHFVITVRVESESPKQELSRASQDWFITAPGTRLESLIYLDENRRPVTKDVFKTSCKGIKQAANQKDARQRICLTLGLGDAQSGVGKKFYEVFQMGTSLEEINDINDFIKQYILPEPEISVETLQSDMRELERLDEVLIETQKRAETLNQIVNACKKAFDLDAQVHINDGYIRYARLKKVSELEEIYQSQIEAANRKLDELEPQREEIKEKLQRAQDSLMKAIHDEESNPEAQAFDFYKTQENELSKDYRNQVKRQQDWGIALNSWDELLKQFNDSDCIPPVHLSGDKIQAMHISEQRDIFLTLRKNLSQSNEDIEETKYQIRSKSNTLLDLITDYTGELKSLKAGKMVYPTAAERVRNSINFELKKRGLVEDAKILCELLHMEDESWQDCVEAVLGIRRFDIIVSPNHYIAAKSAFTAMGQNVENISLVNTYALNNDSQKWASPEHDKLAYHVSSENPYAKQYVSYLLGRFVCCENSEALELHRQSVTRDLLRHHGYRLERMRKQNHYIGANARKKRFENIEKELRLATDEKALLDKKRQLHDSLSSALSVFMHGKSINVLDSNLDAADKVNDLNEELNTIRHKIKEFNENPLLASLFNKVHSCREAYEYIEKEKDIINIQINELEAKVFEAQEKVRENINEVENAEQDYDNFKSEKPDLIKLVETKFMDAAKHKSAADIEFNQKKYHNQCERARDSFIYSELIPLQNSYNAAFICDYKTGIEGADSYINAFESLTHIELERSLENLRQAKIRCKERFRKEILFRLRDDILVAKEQFRELDTVMSKLTYGIEKYRFTMKGNREHEEFYKIILDESNQQITEDNSLFTMQAMSNQAYESQIEEFMDRIIVDIENSAHLAANGKKKPSSQLSKYVDYRTYLEYDIIVENVDTDQSVPLSSVSGDNSGGETQVPFYIAICASLLQIYQHSPNSIRLLLLDEAFNNMTSDRVEPMMKLFTSANLQLILISTAEKCSVIYPFCDLTYSITKSGSIATLMPVEKL